jgi:hypothetical protein
LGHKGLQLEDQRIHIQDLLFPQISHIFGCVRDLEMGRLFRTQVLLQTSKKRRFGAVETDGSQVAGQKCKDPELSHFESSLALIKIFFID